MLIAALLSSTALVRPTPAAAGPVVGFVQGVFAAVSGSAILGGTVASAGFMTGVTFASTALGGFLVKTIIAVGLSKLSAALQPKQPGRRQSDLMTNFAQPISYAETVYGRTRKGGPLGFTAFANNRRWYVPILAAHEIEGVVEHWLDERVVALTPETDPMKSNIATDPMAGYGRIDPFTGSSGQTAHPGLIATFPAEITAAHDFAGLAGAVIWAKRPPQEKFTEIYPQGRQWAYTPVIDGKKVYDPRTGQTAWSDNAALILADWITTILGGDVDWNEVAAEADICDETVINAEGSPQKRWTIGGTLSDDQDYEQQRALLAAACDAWLYERPDGKIGFRVGRWIEPEIVLTAADFFTLDLVEGQWGPDAPSEVVVQYTEPENAWRETLSGTWVEDTTSRQVRDEPAIPTITNHNQAARVAKRLARTKRARYQVRANMGMVGYELIGHRFVRIQHQELGIDSVFEVGELTRDGLSGFTLTANSVEPDDFAFDAATEEPTRPVINEPTSSDDIADVSGVAFSDAGGGVVRASWSPQDDAYTQQVRLRTVGSTDWQVIDVPAGEDYLLIVGQPSGDYEGQARNRTSTGRAGAWSPTTPVAFSVVADPSAPAALSAFSAVAAAPSVDVSWTAPNDQKYAGIRIYRGADTSFANATLITTVYGAPNSSGTYSDTPAAGGHYYWGQPINSSGVGGPASGPIAVSV